jgi:hypothetical protein
VRDAKTPSEGESAAKARAFRVGIAGLLPVTDRRRISDKPSIGW